MKNTISLIIIIMLGAAGLQAQEVTAEFLLEKVDDYRGLEDPSYEMDIQIITTEDKEITEQNTMKVLYKRMPDGLNRSLAFTLTPENQKGRRYLLIGTDTWLYIPGSKKPVKISPAQRLSGNASTGDILSVNYSADYDPVIRGEKKVGMQDTYVLELTAKTSRVTYYTIILYVEKSSYKPVKAEYYSKSGKLLKTGYYRKFKTFYGRTICVELLIVDAIFENKLTFIRYLNFKKRPLEDSIFNKDLIKDVTF